MSKAEEALNKAKSAYLNRKMDQKTFNAVLKKVQPALQAEGKAIDMARILRWQEMRAKMVKSIIDECDVATLDSKTWKLIKKEAGIKKSKFLQKSDADVSKYLSAYQKAHGKFVKEMGEPVGRAVIACREMLVTNKKLQDSFDKFLGSKEFKTELAKDLQASCQQMKKTLVSQFEMLRDYATDSEKEAKQLEATFDQFILTS